MRAAKKKVRAQAGFSFLEVLIALSVLLVGSVAVMSLFAIGAQEAVNRKIEARLAQVRPEVEAIVQDAFDRHSAGGAPRLARQKLSREGYEVDVEFHPSPFGGPRVVAHAVILFRGTPVSVLPPIPLSRSTLNPE
jgi:prepilin-type N-terminal cleavage/methylation domain-containing protein